MVLSNLFGCGQNNKKQNYLEVKDSNVKGIVRTKYDSPEPSKLQINRKKKNIKKIKDLGLPTLNELPVVEDSKSITPRDANEIANRAIALTIVAAKGEGLEQEIINKIIKDWNIDNTFTKQEREFIDNLNPTNQQKVDFTWKYECLNVLLWALGYNESIPEPNEICDVVNDVKIVRENSSEKLVENSKLRTIEEILDMNDYYYRLNWAAVELRVNNNKSDKINEGIINERHYALNWLIRYLNLSWDEMRTDT